MNKILSILLTLLMGIATTTFADTTKYLHLKSMKKILFIFAALLCINAKAQEYKPMLTDGKEWHCIYDVIGADGTYDDNGTWAYTIKVDGDSIIDGTTYKKLYYEYTDSVPRNQEKAFCIAALEKDRKIYQRNNNNDDLLLDFNLHPGDIISPQARATIADEYDIDVRGTKYRYIKLSDYGTWVEGIGTDDMFYTILVENWGYYPVPYHTGNSMVSCYDNGELLFTKEDFRLNTNGIHNIQQSATDNESAYNLAGQPIATPQKGSIFIKGGRKILQR